LRRLKIPQGSSNVFRELILTAPDIDADTFKNDIAPAILNDVKRVTLYASSQDKALDLSESVHGYPRAGDTRDGIIIVPPMETIDASAVDTSLVGHSYFADRSSVISDIYYLIQDSKPASDRFGMMAEKRYGKQYWIFKPRD